MKANVKMQVLTAMFAALTAVGAFVKVPIGSVPITLQFFFIALGAVLLGKYYGALTQIVYVLTGLFIFPIFANGGGIGYIEQPSFGYLLGFIAAAYIIGLITEKLKESSFLALFFSCLVGVVIVYLIGVPYLYLAMKFNLGKSVQLWPIIKAGALVFIPGDIFKCIIAALIGRSVLPALRYMK